MFLSEDAQRDMVSGSEWTKNHIRHSFQAYRGRYEDWAFASVMIFVTALVAFAFACCQGIRENRRLSSRVVGTMVFVTYLVSMCLDGLVYCYASQRATRSNVHDMYHFLVLLASSMTYFAIVYSNSSDSIANTFMTYRRQQEDAEKDNDDRQRKQEESFTDFQTDMSEAMASIREDIMALKREFDATNAASDDFEDRRRRMNTPKVGRRSAAKNTSS